MTNEKPKKLYGKKRVRKEFHVGQRVVLIKSRWKGFLGKWKSRNSAPFIVNKVFVGGVVELCDPREMYTFVVRENKLRSYGKSENASEKVYLMLVDP